MPVRRAKRGRSNPRPRSWTDYKKRIRSTATVVDLAAARRARGVFPGVDEAELQAVATAAKRPTRRAQRTVYQALRARRPKLYAARAQMKKLRVALNRAAFLERQLEDRDGPETWKKLPRARKRTTDLYEAYDRAQRVADAHEPLFPAPRRRRKRWTKDGRPWFGAKKNPTSRARLLARLDKLHDAVARGVSRRSGRPPSKRQIAIEKAYHRTLRAFEYSKRSNPMARRKKKNPWLLRDARGKFSASGTPAWVRKRGRKKAGSAELKYRKRAHKRYRTHAQKLATERMQLAASNLREARRRAGDAAWTKAWKKGERKRRKKERQLHAARVAGLSAMALARKKLRRAAAAHGKKKRKGPQGIQRSTIRREGGGQQVAARRGRKRNPMPPALRRYWAARRRRRNPKALIVNPSRKRRSSMARRRRRRFHHRRRNPGGVVGTVINTVKQAAPALMTGAAIGALDTKVLSGKPAIVGVLAKVGIGIGAALALRKKPALARSIADGAFATLGYQAGVKLLGGVKGGSIEDSSKEISAIVAEDEGAMGVLTSELQGMGVLQVEGAAEDAAALFEGTEPLEFEGGDEGWG